MTVTRAFGPSFLAFHERVTCNLLFIWSAHPYHFQRLPDFEIHGVKEQGNGLFICGFTASRKVYKAEHEAPGVSSAGRLPRVLYLE